MCVYVERETACRGKGTTRASIIIYSTNPGPWTHPTTNSIHPAPPPTEKVCQQ